MRRTIVSAILLVLVTPVLLACNEYNDDSTHTETDTPSAISEQTELTTETTSPAITDVSLPGPLTYPWDNMNMFFGWSIIGKDKIPYVKDLDMTWASLQPHVFWFEIEREKGKYDWTELDNEIEWLQELEVDITFVHSMTGNIYDPNTRKQIREELIALLGQPGINSLADAWIMWNREQNGPEKYGLVPDPFDENDAMMTGMIEFVQAMTERYDGDGTDDWDGLRYPVRIHHILEEWPSPGLDVKTYLGFLAKLSPAIKEADPDAQVMIPGLYMPNRGRVFAYLDGYIEDDDAGIVNGIKYQKSELSRMPDILYSKKAYESILDLGRDYFDIVDIHLYTEKETFYEGEIEYIKGKMKEFGYQKPIWCVEGGGPFRNPEYSPDDPQGDTLFGTTNEKEVAEYVVKCHAMSAAKGLIRQHWGIGGQSQYGYWSGPWNIMNLIEKVTEKKRPAYYTYKIMREKLRDFSTGNVADMSIDEIRVFEFTTPGGKKYVVWDKNGGDNTRITDLSSVLGTRDVKVTQIVTELHDNGNPVIPEVKTYATKSVPVSITPIFIE